MPFDNPVFGGNFLVRPQIQSPNYVAGVSGWTINKDGSVEFNNAIIRGSIQSGVAPGQRFLINPGDGNIIEAYDSNNNRVFTMDALGEAIWSQYNPGNVHTLDTEVTGGGFFVFSRTDLSEFDLTFSASSGVGTQAEMDLTVFNNSLASPHPYEMRFLAGSDDGTLKPTVFGGERGLFGSLVQTVHQSKNNLFYADTYSVTTNASGIGTITHNAGFTPAQAVFGGGGSNTIGVFAWATAHTSTTTTVKVFTASATPFVGTAGLVGIFVG